MGEGESGVCVGGGGGGGEGLKSVVLARKLALNSDSPSNNKYVFGPHRGDLPHQ